MTRARTYTRLVLLTALLVAGLAVVAGPGAAQDDGEIDIAIEPNASAVGPGEVQTYEVIVEGPDSGISAYDGVVVDLSDASVGSIVGFEEQFDEDAGFTASNSEIQNDNATLYLEAVTGESFAAPAEEVVIATFDVQAAESAADGQTTDIVFDSSADQIVADFETVEPYDVAEFQEANMTVDVEFPAILELASVDAPGAIPITDDLKVEYTIENVGDNTGVESAVELVIDITEPTVEDTDTDVTVDPGESVSDTLVFDDVGSLSPGVTIDYTVRIVDFEDNVSGSTTIADGEPDSSVSNLDIADQGSNATLIEGQDRAISLDISNVGELTDTFDVELTVYDQDFTAVVEAEQQTNELDPDESGTVTFDSVTGDLAPGEYSVVLVSGSDNGDHDSTEGGLTVEEGEPASGLSDLDIAGQGTNATIVKGTSEPVTVDVTNVGHAAGQFDVVLDFFTEDGGRVIGGKQETTTSVLAPDETEAVVFEAATDDIDPGEYLVNVTTADGIVSGALTVEASQSPKSSLSNLDIAGQGSTAIIDEGEDASVAVTVENVGEGTGTVDVTLEIATLLGTPVTEQDQTTGPLAPGESELVVFESVTGDLIAGDYTLDVTTADDAVSGELAVGDSGGSLLSNLDIAGQGSTATLVDGEPADVTVAVTNVFDAGDSFDVTLQVGDATEVSQSTGTLEPGQTQTLTFADVAGDLDPGQYDVVVSAVDDEVTGSLTVAAGIDVTGDGNLASDTTGDGLLNDIDGDGTFSIFDVQALFSNLDATVVQNHPGLFNFNGEDNPSTVTIFDVQGLFGQLQAT